MSEKVRLTRKQVAFLKEMLEEEDAEKAATRFMELMVDVRAEPSDIAYYIDKIMGKMKK